MDDCSEIAQRIVEFVRAKAIPYAGNNLKWTSAFYEILGIIGRERGFQVFHERSKDGPEFLVDLAWYSNTGGFELAAECELKSAKEILDDFRKLVCVKSAFKVLIYTVPRTKDGGKDIRDQIESWMAQHTRHTSGEQYLFVEFGARNYYRCYSYIVPNDGTVGSASLSPMQLKATS